MLIFNFDWIQSLQIGR